MSTTEIGTVDNNFAGEISMGLSNHASFEFMMRAAKLFAASSLVPKEFQGNVANCVIALNMAARMKSDPLQVMQSMFVVHGRPSWSSQFLIATFNASPRYTGLKYRMIGTKGKDDRGCVAWSIEQASGEALEGTEVTIVMAKAEGWYAKTGSKWQTMPEQMLRYRAASFFVRTHCPEIAMGMSTKEEEIDSVIDAESSAVVESATERLSKKLYTASVDTYDPSKKDPNLQFTRAAVKDYPGDNSYAVAAAAREARLAEEANISSNAKEN